MVPRALLGVLTVVGLAACAMRDADAGRQHAAGAVWMLVYRHDADGNPISGSKQELLDAVRRGAPIRFAWGFSIERDGGTLTVEHAAEPVFLSIIDGAEVVVQLPEHIAQAAYHDASSALFDDPAVMWRGLMTTQGVFNAVWVNRATGEEMRRHAQRAGLAWFAFQAADPDARQPPLELAVPGGVRRAE